MTATSTADAAGFRAGSWIDGYQAVSPAPVEFIRGYRSRYVDGHTVKGAWSDPWWMYDPDHGWAVARLWRSKAQRVFDWPEKTHTDVHAIEERELAPWPPAPAEPRPEPETEPRREAGEQPEPASPPRCETTEPEHPVCRRCKREAHGWPLQRGDRCSPKDWHRCIRDPLTVAAENEPETITEEGEQTMTTTTDAPPVRPVAREDGDDMGDEPRRAPTFDEVPDEDEAATIDGTRAKTFDQVEEIDQEWLWPGMIPAGLLTVVFGPPKASKTTLVIDYAARISRGDVNPDGTSLGPAAPVLLGALEDISESSTIKRLKGAKADLSMVVDISGGPDGDGLELELDHVAWLHQVAAEHPGTALIIIDTLSNSANKSITTRPALKSMLKPLAKLAETTGAAVILTCHSLKGHDDIPEGGRSLVAIPRMVLQIGKSADEPGVRTLSVYASNVASDSGEGYRYKLIEDGAASRIEWCWDAVRTGPGPEATGQARILLLLRNSDEPLSAQLIAAKTGINYAVTRVLLTRMKHRGQVAQGEERGTWTVPADEPDLQAV